MRETKNQICDALRELDKDDSCYYMDSKGHMIGRVDIASMLAFGAAMIDQIRDKYGEFGISLIKLALDKKEEE